MQSHFGVTLLWLYYVMCTVFTMYICVNLVCNFERLSSCRSRYCMFQGKINGNNVCILSKSLVSILNFGLFFNWRIRNESSMSCAYPKCNVKPMKWNFRICWFEQINERETTDILECFQSMFVHAFTCYMADIFIFISRILSNALNLFSLHLSFSTLSFLYFLHKNLFKRFFIFK